MLTPDAASIERTIATLLSQAFDALNNNSVEQAQSLCHKALSFNQQSSDAHYLLACISEQQQRYEEALPAINRALSISANETDYLILKAQILQQQNKLAEALTCYKVIHANHPTDPNYLNEMALLHESLGALPTAINYYQQTIAIAPAYINAYLNLASLYLDNELFDEADQIIQQALLREPNKPELHCYKASLLTSQKQFVEAIEVCQRLLSTHPDYEPIKINLALAYKGQGKLLEAIALNETILATNPNNTAALLNLGASYKAIGETTQAKKVFRDLLAQEPTHENASFNLSLIELAEGDFAAGWPHFETRKERRNRTEEFISKAIPLWQGQTLNNKRLLIIPEQGHGDYLHFIRFITLIKKQHDCTILLEAQPPLYELIKANPTIDYDELYPTNEYTQSPDYYCSLLSLPFLLALQHSNDCRSQPYLSSKCLAPLIEPNPFTTLDKTKLTIGFCWSGNPAHKGDMFRSSTLTEFTRLFTIPNSNFIALAPQISAAEKQMLSDYPHLIDASPFIKSFADTAKILERVDLVISVDTALTHLAGALGKTTWVLLPMTADWRWQINTSSSLLYSTVTCFRKPSLYDWQTVLQEVHDALLSLDHNHLRSR